MKSNIFDDIYNKKLNLDFKNLKVATNNNISDKYQEQKDKKTLKEANDQEIETLFSNIYNKTSSEEGYSLNEFERSAIDEQLIRARKQADELVKEIYKTKDTIVDRCKDNAFVLDISRSTTLKKAANNVFGGNKTKITYEDYLALGEMKREIIVNETNDILNGED
jgi:hypothetical protein